MAGKGLFLQPLNGVADTGSIKGITKKFASNDNGERHDQLVKVYSAKIPPAKFASLCDGDKLAFVALGQLRNDAVHIYRLLLAGRDFPALSPEEHGFRIYQGLFAIRCAAGTLLEMPLKIKEIVSGMSNLGDVPNHQEHSIVLDAFAAAIGFVKSQNANFLASAASPAPLTHDILPGRSPLEKETARLYAIRNRTAAHYDLKWIAERLALPVLDNGVFFTDENHSINLLSVFSESFRVHQVLQTDDLSSEGLTRALQSLFSSISGTFAMPLITLLDDFITTLMTRMDVWFLNEDVKEAPRTFSLSKTAPFLFLTP